MKRGEVWNARLDPAEGSEQSGSRPVVIVSRDAINRSSSVVNVVPCTTYRDRLARWISRLRIGNWRWAATCTHRKAGYQPAAG